MHGTPHLRPQGVYCGLQAVEVSGIVANDLDGEVSPRHLVEHLANFGERADHRVERGIHACDDPSEIAPVLARVGAGGQLALDRRFGQHVGVGHQGADGLNALVQVVLDGVEVAIVVIGDFRWNIALADLVHVIGRDIERPDHGIQGGIHALDDLAEVAAMPAGVGAGGQLALDRRSGQHIGVGNQGVHRFDALVQVVLDGVEVAIVVIGDFRRNVALADLVHIVGRDIQRPDHGIERGVHAFDDLAEISTVLAGVGTGGQLAF